MKTARERPAEKSGARIIAEIAQGLTSYCTDGFLRTKKGRIDIFRHHKGAANARKFSYPGWNA
ncbi:MULTISPECIES: hypothetical protein [Pseudomonas]|uniref:hypothetical protein n=1 Tax=Pseudomonas TaxID=286 RepID=UPI001364BFB8|nr:hypothetical protein [Pseudomonas fuscovaginae]